MNGELLWADGDLYRVLTDDIVAAGTATLVSRRGTARLIDVTRGLHCRLPLEGGNRLLFDQAWMSFTHLHVTPCGATLEDGRFWSKGTELRLVFAGLVTDWHTTEVGRAAIQALIDRQWPTSPGHPPEPCGALHCTARTDAPRPSQSQAPNGET